MGLPALGSIIGGAITEAGKAARQAAPKAKTPVPVLPRATPFAPFTPSKGAAAPFAAGQKQLAQKVAAAKAKAPVPFLQTPAGKASTARAAASNRFTLGLEQAKMGQQAHAYEQRVGRPVAPQNTAPPLKQLDKAPKAAYTPGQEGLGIPGIITAGKFLASDIPKEVKGTGVFDVAAQKAATITGKLATAGLQLPLGASGVGGGVAKILGNGVEDALDLPTQVLPTGYALGNAAAQAYQGKPAAAKQLIHSYMHGSLLGNVLRGDPGAALHYTAEHPVYAALEALGVKSAADLGAGAAARAGVLGPDLAKRTALADAGGTVSRQPRELIGNATEPQDPYSRRLSTRLRQGKQDPTVRPGESLVAQATGKGLSQRLERHFDRQAGTLEGIRRANRALVIDRRMSQIRGRGSFKTLGMPSRLPIAGSRAVSAFAQGLLADPARLGKDGVPLYRSQLSKLVEYHARPVEGELPYQAANRMDRVAEYQALLDDPRLNANPHEAFKAAVTYAHDHAKLEPDLIKEGVLDNPQQVRVAKLTTPFQFHFDGQDPWVSNPPPLNEAGQRFVAAEKARQDAWRVRQGSLAKVRQADRTLQAASGDERATARVARDQALTEHRANTAAHKDAVARVKALTPGSPWDLHDSPFSVKAPPAHASLDAVRRAHPGVELHATEGPHHITLGLIRTSAATRGAGAAAAAMRDLTAYADSKGKPIEASPIAVKGQGLDSAALNAWYERHGFRANDRTNPALGESLVRSPQPGARKLLSIDEVAKTLKTKHGVDERNIGFVSHRPFQSEEGAYYRPNADPAKGGYYPQKARTGAAFARGQYDTSHDALVRQHLTSQALLDQARGSKMQVKTYALTTRHLADLLEQRKSTLPADQQKAVEGLIEELRAGPVFFGAKGGTSAWTQAENAIRQVQHLHPDLKLTPGRIAHPYAPAEQLDAIAKHTVSSAADRLDPNLWEERGKLPDERFPDSPVLQSAPGSVGVYHKAVADRIKSYDRDTGGTMRTLLRAPASWWRRANLAFSTKHIFGVTQELGIRAAVNGIGPLSYLRALRHANLTERLAADPAFLKDHPEAQMDLQRLNLLTRGTERQQAENLTRHVSSTRLEGTRVGAIAAGIQKAAGHRLAGSPLRATKALLRAYSDTATRILAFERRNIERPFTQAGLGKHLNNEAKRLHGKSLPVIGAVSDVQRKMAEGSLDPKAVDHAARQLAQFYGDWTSASPAVKWAVGVSPFFNWYKNALKFIYHTMPMHHPVKTGVLAALENATAEQRKAMGEGQRAPNRLENSEQGSIPLGGGYALNQQYYSPGGAITSVLEDPLGQILPEIADARKLLEGVNPATGRTLENSEKEQITDAGQRAALAAYAALESFNPPVRELREVLEGGKTSAVGSTAWSPKTKEGAESSEDPLGKALGVPPGIWKPFKPARTSKEYTQAGEPRESGPGPQAHGPTLPRSTVQLPRVTLPRQAVPKLPGVTLPRLTGNAGTARDVADLPLPGIRPRKMQSGVMERRRPPRLKPTRI